MADRGEKTDQGEEAERRIARARSAIGKSFEELIARGEDGSPTPEPVGTGTTLPPDIEVFAGERKGIPAADVPPGASADDIAASVERRVSAWVDGRVRAAERRLELQSEAFEAALGEEAVGARRATEQVEAVRRSLAAAADQALTEVSAAVSDAREQLSGEVRERVDSALKEAELRVRSLGTAMQDEFRSSVLEANRMRIDEAVGDATAALHQAAEIEREDLRRELGVQIAEARSEMAADVDLRVQQELGAALGRVDGEGKRAVAEATTAAAAKAAAEVEERMPALEERIDRGAEDQRAAIEARFGAAEAALRSRIGAAVDEAAGEQDRRLRDEAAAHRKRINEELAAALASTADELRRQLESEREGARREFGAAARTEIAAAVERLDDLHSAAVRDARDAAEAIAASRLADARDGLTGDLQRVHDEARADIERSLGGVDARIFGLFDGLRDEQAADAAAREDEARRRAEVRAAELGEQLGARVERDVSRRFAEAEATLEAANADAAERIRSDARQGAESAIAREVAKGEARLSAATERLDSLAIEKVDAGIEAAEQRLVDRLAARQLEAQSLLDRRFRSLSDELSAGLADESRRAAGEAAEQARAEAASGLAADADAAVASAVEAARGELDRAAAEAARTALADESKRVGEELQQAMAASADEQMRAIREENSRASYRDHNRRAEAAATAQLARSIDALKAQRAELAASLETAAGVSQERRSAMLDAQATASQSAIERGLAGAMAGLDAHAEELRKRTEADVERSAAETVAAEFERRTTALEQRVGSQMAAGEERAAARLAAAVADAERRLAAVEDAQAREERVRERTASAEREAAERVREAEQRLVDVLAKVSAAEQRQS